MEKCEHESCVRKVPIFSDLDHDKIAKLNNLVKQKKFKKGELIYLEGELGKNIYIIESGLVKLYRSNEEGNQYILRLLNEGDFFGELVLFKEEKLSSSAEAVGDCNICLLPKAEIEKLIKSSPELSYKLLSAITSRLNKTENKLQSLALEDAKEKTMRLLLELARESGIEKDNGILINLPLSREGLANLIGTTQETLSRKLSELQKEGLILLQGQKKILIKNN
ncbi:MULTISPECIES: Crp/Fnr family transcriptional regulator [Halanaerobium]|jgi:CRP/FNR family transcriptional regulator|uniref:CRP/FNR family transcriptional regulator, anaerobic regulatory protein n=1 Tax=Halanaerobium kushneri TaxID=56779 RepID=A0A1N6YNG3_9FIRM|nr:MULTISPECIES: Crp/Fnr family transcriptional regulator [Halanaerobium]RCW57483.1 CRP/FNR family transcriptional regulator [Halanaerobium sp. ST460_2HS_T2]SIR16153.1 CRP/FNR family transcriptional regulator, anaerobic regulatory protein [Halanaerobium kushneri]